MIGGVVWTGGRAHGSIVGMRASGRAALISAVMISAGGGGCAAKQTGSSGNTYTLSGPGPEIVGGGLLIVGGVAVARSAGEGDDHYNTASTVFAIGVGIAVIGAIVLGHGVYRLANPPPAATPPPP
jgi:hypothetical protein